MEVEDWDTGEMARLALDPLKSAVENAEGLYKQVGRRARRPSVCCAGVRGWKLWDTASQLTCA